MTALASFLVSGIATYGLPLVTILFFINSLGLPLPSFLIVIMLGVFASQGILDTTSVAMLAIGGAVCGDMIIFSVGRLSRVWLPSKIQSSKYLQKADELFLRHGALAVYITRWLLNPLGPPVSLIAGNSDYSALRFFVVDVLGEMTFILLFGALGYFFSDRSALVAEMISSVSGLLFGLLILAIGTVMVLMSVRKTHGLRHRT